MKTMTIALALLLGGCYAGQFEQPMLRHPTTGQVVNCYVAPTRDNMGFAASDERNCVRAHVQAGFECVNEGCRGQAPR